MTCYVFNLYRNPFSETLENKYSPIDKYTETDSSNIQVYLGHYDRIEISIANNMTSFFTSKSEENNSLDDNSTEKLNGDKQSIYLYDIDSFDKEYQKGTDFISITKHYKFNAVSLLNFTQKASQIFTGLYVRQNLFKHLKKKIEILIKSLQIEDMQFKIMTSLGANDICILWTTDDLDALGLLLPIINKCKYNENDILFFQNYTLISLKINSKHEDDFLTFPDSKTKLQINVTFKLGKEKREFLNKLFSETSLLENANLDSLIENHVKERGASQDLVIEIPCKAIPFKLYNINKNEKSSLFFLDPESNFFREYCLHVHTRVLYPYSINDIDVDFDISDIFSIDKNTLKIKSDFNYNINLEIEKSIIELRQLTNRLIGNKNQTSQVDITPSVEYFFNSNKHIKESFNQLYYDLVRSIYIINNNVWASDLIIQYETVLEYIEKRLEFQEVSDTVKQVVTLIEALRQTYMHITHGSRVFFDAPGSNLAYNGSRRRLVWAYYGILKQMIEISYLLPRKEKQIEIIPILSLSSGTSIKSQGFEVLSKDNTYIEKRIVLFTLPYTALYKILTFTAYLAHEVHHYFIPTERKIRNRLLGTQLLAQLFNTYYQSLVIEHKDEIIMLLKRIEMDFLEFYLNTLDFVIAKYSYLFIYDKYDECLNDIKYSVGHDISELNWDSYKMEVLKFIEDDFSMTLITEKFFKYIQGNAFSFFNNLLASQYDNQKNITLKNWNIFFKKIYPYILNITKTKKSLSINDIDTVEFLTTGVLEACCDYFLIQTLNFSVENYLDLIADYLYTRRIITPKTIFTNLNYDNTRDPIVQSVFLTRLSLILEHFINQDNNSKNISLDEKTRLVENYLDKWYQNNIKLLDGRKKEDRDLSRIESRLNCKDYFLDCYKTNLNNNYYLDYQKLQLSMGTIDVIFTGFFDYKDISIDIKNKIKDNRQKVFDIVTQFKNFSDRHTDIQSSGENKEIRGAKVMQLQLEMVETFTSQKSLKDLRKINNSTYSQICKNLKEENKIISTTWFKTSEKNLKNRCNYMPIKPTTEYSVRSRDEFFSIVTLVVKKLESYNVNNNMFWFRGQKNSKHELKPSLYRDIDVFQGDLYKNQQSYFELFMAKALHTLEVNSSNITSEIDWLACMQHYGVSSNLLDWSELLVSAMYFMLEPLIISKTSKNNSFELKEEIKKMYENGVSLYIFDPYAYNKSWQIALDSTIEKLFYYNNKSLHDNCPLNNNDKREKLRTYSIPNLSIPKSASDFSAYVLGDISLKKHSKINSGVCNLCPLQLPIAIWTGQSNLRLRQQAGTFTAFSLHKSGENNISFEKVQKSLLKYCNVTPFLYKIYITDSKVIDELADWLVISGMHTHNIYPELNNIGTYINDFFKEVKNS